MKQKNGLFPFIVNSHLASVKVGVQQDVPITQTTEQGAEKQPGINILSICVSVRAREGEMWREGERKRERERMGDTAVLCHKL